MGVNDVTPPISIGDHKMSKRPVSNVRQKLTTLLSGGNQAAHGMHTTRGKYVKVSIADLAAICQENPSHPVAKVFLQSCQDAGFGEHRLVDAIDLQAVMEDRESKTVMHKEGDRIVETKVLS